MNDLAFLRLLQLSDTAFPIGSFAHSSGLETYAQSGMTKEDLEQYLRNQLELGWGRLDLATLALAYEAETSQRLKDLCDELSAWKIIPGLQQTSLKLGGRLLTLSKRLFPVVVNDITLAQPHHAVVLGILGKRLEIGLHFLLLAFAQSTMTNQLVATTRCMSLSPEQAQEILVRLQSEVARAIETVLANPEASFFAATPAADIRAHQQAFLYTRLFQS
ncbi:MAG: urease accessory protein UreF [Trueperaceae bacterium]